MTISINHATKVISIPKTDTTYASTSGTGYEVRTYDEYALMRELADYLDSEGWVLSGQKIFTTSAHFADWYWVGARTDATRPKHDGITLFLVPCLLLVLDDFARLIGKRRPSQSAHAQP